MRRSEPKTSVHSSKGRLVVTRSGSPLVALAEHLEEQFRPGSGKGYEAQFVDDQQVEPGQLFLQVQQAPFVPGLHHLMHQTGSGGETHRESALPAGLVGPAAALVFAGEDAGLLVAEGAGAGDGLQEGGQGHLSNSR